MTPIKVLVVDDHALIRNGIQALLKGESTIEVVATKEDGKEALATVKNELPDVVLTDIMMPVMDGIELTKALQKEYPNIKVLAISMYDEYKYIKGMIEAGASGYVLKHADRDELVNAIQTVKDGRQFYSQEVMSKIVDRSLTKNNKQEGDLSKITEREHDVLQLIAKEYSNQEIADELSISLRTVDTHKRNIMKKLGAKNLVSLVKIALKEGLV